MKDTLKELCGKVQGELSTEAAELCGKTNEESTQEIKKAVAVQEIQKAEVVAADEDSFVAERANSRLLLDRV